MKRKTRDDLPAHLLRNRRNKTAKGMTATSKRSGHRVGNSVMPRNEHDSAVLSLNVNGTTDSYHPLMFRTARVNMQGSCPCCGRLHDKLRALNDKGRKALASKRKRRLREGKRV
jgi:hypothetical protein